MRFFRKNTINVKKVEKEDTLQYFIDYSNHKEPDILWSDILTDFTGDKGCLLVVDTDRLYDRNAPDLEEKISKLTNELGQRQIPWQQTVTKKESDLTVLGLKLQNQQKRNCYQVGVAVMPEKREEILELVRDYTVFVYTYSDSISGDILLKQFTEAKGDNEELSAGALVVLYNDRYLKRLGIFGRPDAVSLMEEKLAGVN